MNILAHRGLWKKEEEKNTIEAIKKSIELGFGIEIDVRDYQGEIIIYHDIPPKNLNPLYLKDILPLLKKKNLPIAINIKADGLRDSLLEILYGYNNYFTFDMSLPELKKYQETDIITFSGSSDILPSPPLLEKSSGIWLDCFFSHWYKEDIIRNHLEKGKKVCLVSCELHGRDYKIFWEWLKETTLGENPNLFICTDLPREAKAFFY